MKMFLKVIKVLLNTLITIILIFGTLFIILYVIGIEPYVVETGSMEPGIQRGSLSFINTHVDYDSINENDVIAFSLSSGKKVTHRVIKKTDEGLETKGDSNNISDGISTTRDNYFGKNIFSIPKLGYLVMIIQTARGKIILGTAIIVLLIVGFLFGDSKEKNEKEDSENNKKKANEKEE